VDVGLAAGLFRIEGASTATSALQITNGVSPPCVDHARGAVLAYRTGNERCAIDAWGETAIKAPSRMGLRHARLSLPVDVDAARFAAEQQVVPAF
jgi:hypothetical protein